MIILGITDKTTEPIRLTGHPTFFAIMIVMIIAG
jgi:hypothetical protein